MQFLFHGKYTIITIIVNDCYFLRSRLLFGSKKKKKKKNNKPDIAS